MDYVLATLINFSIVGFALTMAFDFAAGLHKLWLKTEAKGIKPSDTPGDQKEVHTLHTLDTKPRYAPSIPDAKDSVLAATLGNEPEPFTTLVSEDFWMLPLEPLEKELTCCCHTAIATQLLLSPALDAQRHPPNLATLNTTQLRSTCQSAGIRWRNADGTKHLSKGEMLLALSQ